MGGRGRKQEPKNRNSWEWLKDVETDRLENYIKRSRYLGDKPDPQGRSIHDVGYHAERELKRRQG